MKKILLSILLLGLFGSQAGLANPIPTPFIVEYSVSPPWIKVPNYFYNINGDTLRTLEGIAKITDTTSGFGIITLDSTNTTGFILNQDSDSIQFRDNGIYADLAYGILGNEGLPPLPGESVIGGPFHLSSYPWGVYGIGYAFYETPSIPYYDMFVGGYWGTCGLIINEVNLHCTWQPNSNFIELYNRGGAPVATDSLALIGNSRWELPDGIIINPGQFLVLDENSFPSGFTLNPSGDNLYLVRDVNYGPDEVFDQVGWSTDHGENISFMRYPDGNANPDSIDDFRGYNDESSITFSDGFPTRGAPNRYDCPGLKIIGIHCDTSDGSANIFWTNPIWLSVFSRAILRRSTEAFPSTPYDGDLIYEGDGQGYSDRDVAPGYTYYYTVFALTESGDYSVPDSESQISVYFPNVRVNENPIPEKAVMLECYPNPFNSNTLIRYNLTAPGLARLEIYNLAGQRVATLANGRQEAGEHSISWNGSSMASGIYFARLECGSYQNRIKLVLLK